METVIQTLPTKLLFYESLLSIRFGGGGGGGGGSGIGRCCSAEHKSMC